MNLISKIILKFISIIITPFIKDSNKRLSYLRFMQKLGFSALPQRYWEPVPLVESIDSITKIPTLIMNDIPESEFEKVIERKFLNKEYLDEFKKNISSIASNKMFCGFDAFVYSEIIRNFNPKKIIEIGAGYSTFVALDNINKNAIINCIEPYPSEFLKKLVTDNKEKVLLTEKKIQDFYQDEVFSSLEPNDILFIDSTHVVLIGGDLPVIFLRILPKIKKGVLIHFHDVSIPYEYPRKLVYKSGRFYNELYMVGNLVTNCDYSFIFGSYHFLLEKKLLNENDIYNFGLSVWLRKN